MTATKLGPRRDCPIEGCDRAVGNGKLMCGPCWRAVPPDLQRRVYRTWRIWLRGRSDAAFQAYSEARAEAIEAV